MSGSDDLRRYLQRGVRLVQEKGLWGAVPDLKWRLQRRLRASPSLSPLEEWLSYYRRCASQPAAPGGLENASALPKVSILVLTYNNLILSQICLSSILCNTTYRNYEVIVVDNGSTDTTPAWLRTSAEEHPEFKLILNASNLGFPVANNQAAREASGEFLIFLNNDTVVTKFWIERLLGHLRADPSIGLVGPVSNGTGNEARIPTYYDSPAAMESLAGERAMAAAGRQFDIRTLALYCVMARKNQYDAIGGLDEGFGVGMFEDEDLAVRYQERGLRVVCAEDVFIHHFWRAAFGRMEKRRYDRLFTENKQRFEAKWERTWQPYQLRRVLRASSRTGQLPEIPTLSDVISYECNICGRTCETSVADLGRELPSCQCGSTVRARALIHVLSSELFGRSLALHDFPRRHDVRGWGMSDPFHPELLVRKLDYVNTFFDRGPRFDISAPLKPGQESTLDFLVSSEVFEHVAPPVSRAFENARRLLKPGGVLVLTVPYTLEPRTLEHFPDLHQYELIKPKGAPPRLKNTTQDGREQIYENLAFHGGEGSVLEMRVFSKAGLLEDLSRAGFGSVKIYDEPNWKFGIYWRVPYSLPLAARPN